MESVFFDLFFLASPISIIAIKRGDFLVVKPVVWQSSPVFP